MIRCFPCSLKWSDMARIASVGNPSQPMFRLLVADMHFGRSTSDVSLLIVDIQSTTSHRRLCWSTSEPWQQHQQHTLSQLRGTTLTHEFVCLLGLTMMSRCSIVLSNAVLHPSFMLWYVSECRPYFTIGCCPDAVPKDH